MSAHITLPIDAFEQEIVQAVRKNRVTVISAETGAGKSTRVPAMLMRGGFCVGGKMIGVTEPLRLSASLIPEFVAKTLGCQVGEHVGYQIGGERVFDPKTTLIKYMTIGVMNNELHRDPHLRRYSVVIADEIHERSIEQDLQLAMLKKLLDLREDLKVVVMSATFDTNQYADYFGVCQDAIITVPGRTFPVDVHYLRDEPDDPVAACADQIGQIVRRRLPGDILTFLPDEKSINKVRDLLAKQELGIAVHRLLRNQTKEERDSAVYARGDQRVILSTNIAETGVTVDGVRHVVDSGLVKQDVYVSAAMSALEVVPHSQAGCNQRMGRAGRTQSGECWRMYTKEDFDHRFGYTRPAILRSALDSTLLQLRCLGYSQDEVLSLGLLDDPGVKRWTEADERLKLLGALDAQGSVTDDGRVINRLPVSPMLARIILAGNKYGCLREAVIMAAGLAARPVYYNVPKEEREQVDAARAAFVNEASDHLTLLAVWQAWDRNRDTDGWAREKCVSFQALREIDRLCDQIVSALQSAGFEFSSSENQQLLLKSVASGLVINLAVKGGRFNYSWQGQQTYVFPGSVMFGTQTPELLVCAQVVETSKAFMRGCSAFDKQWLSELIPAELLEKAITVQHDYLTGGKKLVATVSWQGQVLSEQPIEELDEKLCAFLAIHIVEGVHAGYGFHPQTSVLRVVWKRLVKTLNVHLWEGVEHEALRESVAALRLAIAKKIKRCKTLEQVMATDLDIQWETILGEDLWATIKESAEQEAQQEAEHAARRAEEDRRYQQEAEKRAAARKAENAERTERVTKKWNEELWPILQHCQPWPREIRWGIEEIRDAVNRGSVPRYSEQSLGRIERYASEQVAIMRSSKQGATALRDAVLERYPACPLCGGLWQDDSHYVLSCDNQEQHEVGRLIPLKTQTSLIGRFYTVRRGEREGELVAEVFLRPSMVEISFSFTMNAGWQRAKFKGVSYKPYQAILPLHLLSEREQIAADVAELEQARVELEDMQRRLQDLKAEVGNGGVKKITFATVDGKSAAREGNTVYEAVMQEPYPAPGETWFCRLGLNVGGGGRRVMSVYPLMKVEGSITSADDLQELSELIAEAYPGLPQELIQ